MPEIDADSLLLASKILSVTFAILITLANANLIFKIVRKPKFYQSSKFLVLISLAVGDIFHGIYSMLVYALLAYGELTNNNCSTVITAQYYHDFVISFVYGVGILVLALEVSIRPKINAGTHNLPTLVGLVLSFLPWVLVLGFVIPLTVAGINWDACNYTFSESILRAIFWLTDIIPPVVAVFVCFLILCYRNSGIQTTHSVINNHNNRCYGNSNPLYNYPNQQPIPQQHHPDASTKSDINLYEAPPQYYNPEPLPNSYTDEQVFFSATQPLIPHNVFLDNPVKEKNILMRVAFAYLACVLPYGALAVSGGTLSFYWTIVLQQTFFWFLTFRSILTPAIFLSNK